MQILFKLILVWGFGFLQPALAQPELWSQEFLVSSDEASKFNLKENSYKLTPKINLDGPWDDFVNSLSSSRLIRWGLNWESAKSYSRNETNSFSPASVLKVLTATTALKVLGSDYRFTNFFHGQFNVATATLTQPEFEVSGDPTWGHPAYDETLYDRVDRVVTELVAQGVKKINGKINVTLNNPGVGSFARPSRWKQSWLLQCYATIPTAVTLYGNCATFKVNSIKTATWLNADVSVSLVVKNLISTTEPSSIQVNAVLDEQGKVIQYQISGSYNSSDASVYSVPVHHNENWLKNIFLRRLKRASITYTSTAYTATDSLNQATQDNLSSFTVDLSSKPLGEILPPFLRNSINLIGDRLYIEVGDRMRNQLFEVSQSLPEQQAVLEAVKIYDGSGLIADNQLSPKIIYHYLVGLKTESYFDIFLNSLAVSGDALMSGTLGSRMSTEPLKGAIFAKTGTLDGVSALAGYYKKLNSFEPFVIMDVESPRLSAAAAKRLEDKIVTRFVLDNLAK